MDNVDTAETGDRASFMVFRTPLLLRPPPAFFFDPQDIFSSGQGGCPDVCPARCSVPMLRSVYDYTGDLKQNFLPIISVTAFLVLPVIPFRAGELSRSLPCPSFLSRFYIAFPVLLFWII